jgi:hypothetical protein
LDIRATACFAPSAPASFPDSQPHRGGSFTPILISSRRSAQQATGIPPLEYVHTLRIEAAKQMLEAGDAPMEAIAQEVGYEDAGFFGRLFRRKREAHAGAVSEKVSGHVASAGVRGRAIPDRPAYRE